MRSTAARPDGNTPGIGVWLRPEQAPLVRAACAAAGVIIRAAGSSQRGRAAELAQDLGAAPVDDLRTLVAESRCDLLLICDASDLDPDSGPADARRFRAARERGARVASLEPIPDGPMALGPGGWLEGQSAGLELVRLAPLPRLSRAVREAAEAIDSLKPPTALAIEAYSTPEEGSLAARLAGAMDLALALLGEPESIDAVRTPPAGAPPPPPSVEPSLAGLSGTMTAHLRFAGGRSGTIVASDQAGRWNTTVTLLGQAGRLRIYDDGFEWIGPRGEKLDELRTRTRGRAASLPGAPSALAVQALADAIRQLQAPDAGVTPEHWSAVLCMSQAALLSARTGQSETPATIRRMAGL